VRKPKKERWFLIIDEQDQKVVLVKTSGDADAAKEKYFKMCGLDDEDLRDAMKEHEGITVDPLDRLLNSSLSYHELWG